MKTIIVLLITVCTTGLGRVRRVLKMYILLCWVNNIVGWVGLGPVNWTHVYLCSTLLTFVAVWTLTNFSMLRT